MARITDKDYGYKNIVRSLDKIKGSHVKVGLQGTTGQKTYSEKFDKVTVVDVGVINEFGAKHIPERSFLRSTFDEQYNKWIEMNKRLFWDTIFKFLGSTYGAGLSKALGIMGETIKKDIKEKIKAGISPANAPSTLRAKLRKGKWNKGATSTKSPKPLIDTGQMINSITYEKVIK